MTAVVKCVGANANAGPCVCGHHDEIPTVDRAARALAADLHGRDVWPDLPEYLRGEWRRRVDLVLRKAGAES